jgi:hypothetical protein
MFIILCLAETFLQFGLSGATLLAAQRIAPRRAGFEASAGSAER